MSNAKWIASGFRRALGLTGGVALMAFQAQAGLAYTYKSDSPDATKVLGADFAQSLGPVTAKPRDAHRRHPEEPQQPILAGHRERREGRRQGLWRRSQRAGGEFRIGPHPAVDHRADDDRKEVRRLYRVAGSFLELTPAIKQMQEAGVPIINTDDARIAGSVYVGPNHELDGSQAADFIAEHLPDGGDVAQMKVRPDRTPQSCE